MKYNIYSCAAKNGAIKIKAKRKTKVN